MICSECAWEADAVQGRTEGPQITHREIHAYNKWAKHLKDPENNTVGHEACTGCDCHHRLIPGREGSLDDN